MQRKWAILGGSMNMIEKQEWLSDFQNFSTEKVN